MHRHAANYAVKLVRSLPLLLAPPARSLSLNSAINRGIRRSQQPSWEQDRVKTSSFITPSDSRRSAYDTIETSLKRRDSEPEWKTKGRETKSWRARNDAPRRSEGNNYDRREDRGRLTKPWRSRDDAPERSGENKYGRRELGSKKSFHASEAADKKPWETRERMVSLDRSEKSSFIRSSGNNHDHESDVPRNRVSRRLSDLSSMRYERRTKPFHDRPSQPNVGDTKVLRYTMGEHTPETPIDGRPRYIQGEHTIVKENPGVGAREKETKASRTTERRPRLGGRGRVDSKFVRKDPIVVPYTTAASEFIYGAGSVYAALRAGRRKFYKLYTSEHNQKTLRNDIEGLARSLHIPKQTCIDDQVHLLTKMCKGRPHNGYVLEASPIPKLPTEYLPHFELKQESFRVESGPQSREDSSINGTSFLVPIPKNRHPYPLVLLLEEVKDEGNFGSIIRTAYYMGATAIVYNTRGSAPVSPIAVKASAGAAEIIPLLNITNATEDFVERSRKRGWKVYASVATDSVKEKSKRGESKQTRSTLNLTEVASALDEAPCILVLGSEGAGISRKILASADDLVSIRGSRREVSADGLDSLNVSVATGLLCSAFLGTEANSRNRRAAEEAVVAEGEEEEVEAKKFGDVRAEDRLF